MKLFCHTPVGRSCDRTTTRHTRPDLETLEDRWLPSSSSITGNFNGTAIPAGTTLWLTSAFKVNGLGSTPVTLDFTNDTISFTANGTNYTWTAPNAEVKISPTATTATTTFDAATNTWETTLPTHFSGNAFLDALAVPLPSGLPGGIKNVTWQGDFTSNTAGLSVNWQWAAAVYTHFSSDYNALNVKPVDDNHVSVYQNSDHAGTPEAFLPYVIGGATGGGGSNYTGSLSATASVVPNVPQPASLSGVVYNGTQGGTISGVTLTLWELVNGQYVYKATTTTAGDGSYKFSNLQPGTYEIIQSPPSPPMGFTSETTTSSAGTVDGTTDGMVPPNISNVINGINLASGNNGVNYNFTDVFSGS
jgi:hypothetical protein